VEKIQKILVMVTLVFLTISINTVIAKNASSSQKDHWQAPVTAKNTQNPMLNNQKAVEAGATIFKQQCATCHGSAGKGDGPASQFLGKPVPNLTSGQVQSQTDGELFWKISNGNAPMPTFKASLTDEQRWQVITFLRTLKSK